MLERLTYAKCHIPKMNSAWHAHIWNLTFHVIILSRRSASSSLSNGRSATTSLICFQHVK